MEIPLILLCKELINRFRRHNRSIHDRNLFCHIVCIQILIVLLLLSLLESGFELFFGLLTRLNSQHREIIDRDSSHQTLHGMYIKLLPKRITRKNQFGLGMINDMRYITRLEVLKNRYNDSTIRNRCHIGHRPITTVLANQSNTVVFLNTCLTKNKMNFLNTLCYITIGVHTSMTVIGHGRTVPVHSNGIFEQTDKIGLDHNGNLLY